jgi:membrane protein DedA with SNARE-associated domain/rhodanese-related sulfurtransferase
MDTLMHIIAVYGLWVVFVCVVLDQGGLPLPSYPVMIATAGLAAEADQPLLPILLVAALAAVLADLLWFLGGRRFGASLLRLMCKLSLSPDSCIGMTRRVYARWGAPSLIVSKYVPGFAAVATTLAGESGVSLRRFILFDALGAALWAGGAIALGAIFHDAVEAVLLQLEELGHFALIILLAALLLFVAVKWWQRYRFLMQIRMARISVDELDALLESGSPPTILDVRGIERRARYGWIPGSVALSDPTSLELDRAQELIVYCDCPNDASAAMTAVILRKKGYSRVRPLAGGFDAWRSRGLRLEQDVVNP